MLPTLLVLTALGSPTLPDGWDATHTRLGVAGATAWGIGAGLMTTAHALSFARPYGREARTWETIAYGSGLSMALGGYVGLSRAALEQRRTLEGQGWTVRSRQRHLAVIHALAGATLFGLGLAMNRDGYLHSQLPATLYVVTLPVYPLFQARANRRAGRG